MLLFVHKLYSILKFIGFSFIISAESDHLSITAIHVTILSRFDHCNKLLTSLPLAFAFADQWPCHWPKSPYIILCHSSAQNPLRFSNSFRVKANSLQWPSRSYIIYSSSLWPHLLTIFPMLIPFQTINTEGWCSPQSLSNLH